MQHPRIAATHRSSATNKALLAIAVIGTLIAVSARAQNTVASTKSSGEPLEEVVVTAQKRAENLQDVPVAMQVISNQTLAESNRNSLEDLSKSVPGINITSRATSNLITIRGIGSGENPSFDQSVAMFTDDIFHGRSRMSLGAFLDLDHIEVLKGPQSTFFGNNAIAGAFNIVSMKPGKNFDAWMRALYGQYGQFAAEGAVGGPVTDTFGIRVAATYNGTNGWLDNVTYGDHVPRIRNVAGRVTFAFNPNEVLDATLKIEASRHTTFGSAYDLPEQMSNCPPPAPLPVNFSHFGVCQTALSRGLPVGIETNSIAQLDDQKNTLNTFENVLTINYHPGDHTLTSVTGFYNYGAEARFNTDQLPLRSDVLLNADIPEHYHQFSQEFRIASPTHQRFEYLAGVYFQSDTLRVRQEVALPLAGTPANGYPLDISLPIDQDEKVYSLFGALTWNILSNLKLNAGLRWSQTTKDADLSHHYGAATNFWGGFAPISPAFETLWGPSFGPAGTVTLSRKDHDVMPSAGLQFQITPDAMAYISYSRGFKAGGYSNDLVPNPSYEYGPEYADAYEIGLKSKWFDDRVLLNMDVFRTNYKGLQVNSIVLDQNTQLFGSVVNNAAKAVSQGVETELQWAVSSHFRVGANVTYLDAHFTDYRNAPSNSDLQNYCASSQAVFNSTPQCAAYYGTFPVPATIDLSGTPTPYSPRWTGSVNAAYTVALPGDYELVGELTPYFSSSYNHEKPDLPGVYNNAYVRWDARLTLESMDHHLAFDVIGKNLTDKTIIAFPTLGFQSKEQPRSVAAQVRYKW